jgi:hypothetical protein
MLARRLIVAGKCSGQFASSIDSVRAPDGALIVDYKWNFGDCALLDAGASVPEGQGHTEKKSKAAQSRLTDTRQKAIFLRLWLSDLVI